MLHDDDDEAERSSTYMHEAVSLEIVLKSAGDDSLLFDGLNIHSFIHSFQAFI